uniref:Uncharacterized protein n=1 Tax=Mandrillus leucophaeus TaxID=9568 RepID=A0A2K5XQ49_MANLE
MAAFSRPLGTCTATTCCSSPSATTSSGGSCTSRLQRLGARRAVPGSPRTSWWTWATWRVRTPAKKTWSSSSTTTCAGCTLCSRNSRAKPTSSLTDTSRRSASAIGATEAWRPRLPSTLFDPSHPLSFLKAFFLFFLAGGREGQTANWGAAYVQEARWGCVEEGASCEREENGGRRGEGPRNLLGGGLHSMLVGMGLG